MEVITRQIETTQVDKRLFDQFMLDEDFNVPDSKTPNIKAVNQHRHGMCAAISIVRKKMAYEDKSNFLFEF